MNDTLIEKPAFPGASTYKVRARFLLQGIGAASAGRPSRLGHPVATVSPLEDGIADFDRPPWPETEDGTWTEAKNQRRCELIDRKYVGSLTPVETRELARLQAQMLRHRQRVAPLPLEDARRLYQELLAGAIASRSPTDS
jgi:hypothetical protein